MTLNIALDIDGTITSNPAFFALLSHSVHGDGGQVFVVTSRSNTAAVEKETRAELTAYEIAFDALYVIADRGSEQQIPCPHDDLDWYQQYLWQKVKFCTDHDVHIIFEDDDKVVTLFQRFAPDIQVFHVR